jgi:hypothetical protein
MSEISDADFIKAQQSLEAFKKQLEELALSHEKRLNEMTLQFMEYFEQFRTAPGGDQYQQVIKDRNIFREHYHREKHSNASLEDKIRFYESGGSLRSDIYRYVYYLADENQIIIVEHFDPGYGSPKLADNSNVIFLGML